MGMIAVDDAFKLLPEVLDQDLVGLGWAPHDAAAAPVVRDGSMVLRTDAAPE
jgi:hypothetical protein